MVVFVLLAAALVLIAAGLLAVPLFKARSRFKLAVGTAIACTGLLLLGATVFYMALSTGPSRTPSAAGSPAFMVEQLAQHLKSHPEDLNGWMMLGRSELVLKRYPLAVRAYRHADRLTHGGNADALLGEAQALLLIDASQLTGRAGGLIERALVLAPMDPRALYLGGIVALHREQLALARTRFQQLLKLNPPSRIRNVARAQIASIDRQLGNSLLAADALIKPAGTGPVIRVTLTLASALAKRVPYTAPLYVFVRDAVQRGSPLAVKRLNSRFPQTVLLTPADSMMPGHTFSTGERVDVVARVAPSGNPFDEPGDVSGQATYRVTRDGRVNILIDHVTP